MTQDKRDNKKKRFLIELAKSKGIISMACENTGIVRNSFYQWLKKDTAFKKEVENVNEQTIDFVEGQLFKLISGAKYGDKIVPPDTAAIIFYLKTKAKSRGYVERQELTGKDGDKLFPSWLSKTEKI